VLVVGVLYYGLNKNRIRLERAAQIEKRDKLEKWIKHNNG
jgi:hypothetical protein